MLRLQEQIKEKISGQNGKLVYAVSADEATDCSNMEQLAIVIRSVGKGGIIHERLLEYVDMEAITWTAVADAIINCLQNHNLDDSDCRAQTYDGADSMVSHLNGSYYQNTTPRSVHSLCQQSTQLVPQRHLCCPGIPYYDGKVKEAKYLFQILPKRSRVLEKLLAAANPPVAIKKVCIKCIAVQIPSNLSTEPCFMSVSNKL